MRGAYFVLAKLGLRLASINPSASPIWPPTGLALAAVLLGGSRIWPAIFIGAFAANATTAGTLETSAFIALGNTLEALAGGYLIARWSGGVETFTSPSRVAKFALVAVGPATVDQRHHRRGDAERGGLCATGTKFSPIWITWWLGDAAGALVVTPVIVLWAQSRLARTSTRAMLGGSIAVLGSAVAVGLIAFSPLLPRSEYTSPLGFLAILPLVWAALRRGPRDTATRRPDPRPALPSGRRSSMPGRSANIGLNESFLLLLTFMISVSVPSLALSADVAMRQATEDTLRRTQIDLDQRVQGAHRGARRRQYPSHARRSAWPISAAGRWDIVANHDHLVRTVVRDLRASAPASSKARCNEFVGFIHPDDRAQVGASIGAALKSGKEFSHEERIVRPDGSIRHLHSVGEVVRDENGAAIRMLGICLDVTERKQAERALQESEQNYRLLLKRRARLRDLHARRARPRAQLERRRPAPERLCGRRDHRPPFPHFPARGGARRRHGRTRRWSPPRARASSTAETWLVRKDGSRSTPAS